jgi:hypothetical protein
MRTIATILFSTLCTLSMAQTKIQGKVLDAQQHPVPLANIFLKDTYDGVSSDEQGNFEFTSTETGAQVLVVTVIGFKEFSRALVLEGKPLTVNVKLEESINELEAVTISAGAFTASDESRRTVFRAVDIATTAGATADIAGALNTLPGTQKVGESGRLFVRGGDGNEARTFIDGLLVLDAYSPSAPNTPSRGRFLPFMFKGTSFSTGGYSSEYGQALSSALVLESKDESEMSRTDIGLLSVGGDIGHTQAWDKGSVAGKIEYTNLTPYMGLINQRVDWKSPPVSMEGVAAFRQRVGKYGMVKAYGNLTQSEFSLYNHSIDDYNQKNLYKLKNGYRYFNSFYKDAINENWMLRSGLSYTSIKNDVTIDGRPINETENGIHGKLVATGSLSDHIEMKTGAEVISRTYEQYGNEGTPDAFRFDFRETITAVFAEADLYASNKFVTRIGGRTEYNDLTGEFKFDPRISLAYKTGADGQISFAYGTFRQSPKNQFVKINEALTSEKAEHFILNYQRVENNRTFRIETYYKRYDDLIKTEHSILTNSGSGYARGIELFWRDNESVDNLDYWISYSFLDTERKYLNFPGKVIPTFASKHNFSLVGKYFVQKLKSQIGATYSISSGRPYNNPNEEKFNNGRTPNYQDVSFNWSYLPKPSLIIHFSCTNVLGINNIFGYEYSNTLNENGQYNSRALRQAAPRFLFIAFFITISKDKSMNQLRTL